MRKILTKTLVILVLTAPMVSSALVYSGSNLKNDEYQRLENPPLDPAYDDKESINEHRKKVVNYLRRAEIYVENADSDIKRIQSNRLDAIQRARIEAEKYGLTTNLPPG